MDASVSQPALRQVALLPPSPASCIETAWILLIDFLKSGSLPTSRWNGPSQSYSGNLSMWDPGEQTEKGLSLAFRTGAAAAPPGWQSPGTVASTALQISRHSLKKKLLFLVEDSVLCLRGA